MLTAEHVRARRRDGKLVLSPLRAQLRARALEIAGELLAVAGAHVGSPRGELLEAFRAIDVEAREHRLAEGLKKLVLDAIEFEAEGDVDPEALRDRVFRRASAARASLDAGAAFDRDAVLREVAAEVGLAKDALERALYADLRDAHRQLTAPAMSAETLLERYELGQAQAVLLRAERIVVEVACASPAAYRALFRKLKFLRLLHTIEALPNGTYRIAIDGPYSLFASVTKYGRELAMLLPTLRACDRFALRADIRWGKSKERLGFEIESALARRGRAKPAEDVPAADLSPDAAALLAAFEKRAGPWRASPGAEVLDLPGVGTCVPDLVFEHATTGECIYLELLGYWSRDAVWKRVELVQSGLPVRILFGVPERLRVSEAVLPEPLPGALVTYRSKLLPGQVEAKLNELSGRVEKGA